MALFYWHLFKQYFLEYFSGYNFELNLSKRIAHISTLALIKSIFAQVLEIGGVYILFYKYKDVTVLRLFLS